MMLRTSATQVTEYLACPRKWWHGYKLKLPRPQNAAAEMGSACHEILEHYQNTGELKGDPTLVTYCRPALANIPPPQTPGVCIEQKFEIETYPGGPKWVGYMDLSWHSPPGHATVIDHKTRSDFRYCAKPEELQVDVQLASYAWAVIGEWPDVQNVTVAHNYILTPRPGQNTEQRKPKTKLVSVDLTRSQVELLWEKSLGTVREMAALHALPENTPIETIPPNTTECEKYGGCHFKKQCGFVDPKNPPLFNFLNTRKEQQMTETNGINSSKPILTAAERLRQFKAGGAPAAALAVVKPQAAASSPMAPPDATPDVATLPQTAVEPPEAPATGSEPAKRRGRPPKAAQGDAPQATSAAAPAVQTAPAVTPATPEVAPATRKPFLLLVNAAPLKGFPGAVLFDDWFAPAAADLATEHGVAHFMLLDFGKQKAAVVAATQKLARTGLPPALLVYTRSPGAEEAIAALTPYATHMVRS